MSQRLKVEIIMQIVDKAFAKSDLHYFKRWLKSQKLNMTSLIRKRLYEISVERELSDNEIDFLDELLKAALDREVEMKMSARAAAERKTSAQVNAV